MLLIKSSIFIHFLKKFYSVLKIHIFFIDFYLYVCYNTLLYAEVFI